MVTILVYSQIMEGRDREHMVYVKSSVFGHILAQSDAGIDNRADLSTFEAVVDVETNRLTKEATGSHELDASDEDYEDSEDEEGSKDDDKEEEAVKEKESGEESENEDESNEEDEKKEESEEEGVNGDDPIAAYPFDPRAGNIDAVIPQIKINYPKLSEKIQKLVPNAPNSKIRKLLSSLAKALFDISCGDYHLGTHPSLKPAPHSIDEKKFTQERDDAAVERALALAKETVLDPKVMRDFRNFEQERNILVKSRKRIKRKRSLQKTIQLQKALAKSGKSSQIPETNVNDRKTVESLEQKTVESGIKRKLSNDDSNAQPVPKKQKKVKADKEQGLIKSFPKKEKVEKNINSKISKVKTPKVKNPKTKISISPKTSGEKSVPTKKQTPIDTPKPVTPLSQKTSSKVPTPKPVNQLVKKTSSNVATPMSKKTPPVVKTINSKARSPKRQSTPIGIKINLEGNKQHDFSDYRRSILASPAVPFQPNKTPLKTALKATDSPILIKKKFQHLAAKRSTEATAPLAKTASPLPKKKLTTLQKEMKKKRHLMSVTSAEPVKSTKKSMKKRSFAADFF